MQMTKAKSFCEGNLMLVWKRFRRPDDRQLDVRKYELCFVEGWGGHRRNFACSRTGEMS